MSVGITNTERAIKAYKDNQEDIWEKIEREHDYPMFAADVEQLAEFGMGVLRSWLKHLNQWHHWVSADAQRYSKEEYSLITMIEDMATKATKGTLKLIDTVKALGHDIEREATFRSLADDILAGRAERYSVDKELRDEALEEYETGKTEPVEHWGQ